jgi:hypothetical protein
MKEPHLTHRSAARTAENHDHEQCSSSSSTFTVDDALDRCAATGAFHWLLLLYTGMSWACDAMEVGNELFAPHLLVFFLCVEERRVGAPGTKGGAGSGDRWANSGWAVSGTV